MNISLSPTVSMVGSPTATGEFDLLFSPSVTFVGVDYIATVALDLAVAIGMLATANSVGEFTLSLSPVIGMVGAEHYTASFALTLTPTLVATAYVKQLPHPIPWTL